MERMPAERATRIWNERLLTAAFWAIPSLLCLLIYWPGFICWFQQDDFSWLALRTEWQNGNGLVNILFTPRAQGSVRFLGDRTFFLVLSSLFGLNSLPYHAAVLVTQVANLVLLSAIAQRLTGSRTAAFLAPLFWVANDALAGPLSWLSAYNQVLCAFFILLAFYSLLRYIDEGRHVFLYAQWAAFLLGFGALEINVVYPALATGYTFLCARKHVKHTLALWIPSILFTALHWWFIPKPTSGAYKLFLDGGIIDTFWLYWQWALGPKRLGLIRPVRSWFAPAGTALLTLALLCFLVARARKAGRLAIFGLWWFVVTLAPVLPLKNHISNYYLMLPAVGLSLWGAWAVASVSRRPWPARGAAALAVLYFVSSIPVGFVVAEAHLIHGRQAKQFIYSVVDAQQRHPGKTILLQGVDEELFWAAIFDEPFRLFSISKIYLAPGEAVPEQGVQWRSPAEYVYDPRQTVCELSKGQAVVYEVTETGVRDVTAQYYATATQRWGPCEAS
jgi:hypothetical protein